MKRLFSLMLLVVLFDLADAQEGWPHGRIRVTADGHYLEYADGTPFFWLGDTGWEIFQKLDTASIDMYLEDRRKKGFNVIQAVILTESPNYYGDRSMVGNDPLKPVEKYFQLVDRVVRVAMKKNMVIAFVPSWGDKVTAIRSKVPALFNKSNAYGYGLYLGRRYKDYPNVIWIAGGDNPAFVDTADWRPIFRAMIKGMREGSEGKELITYHPWGENSSTAYWLEPNTLDMQMMQTGHAKHDITGWDWVHRDRAYQPVRPVLDGEPNYEDHPVNWDTANGYFRDYDVRKAIYRSVFAGACGVTYGHHAVWQFYGPSDKHPFAYPDRYWKDALDRPGAYQMGYMKELMLSIPVNRRVPDDAIIVEGQGVGGEYITAFRGDDSSYAMVYMPVGKTIGLDMHWVKGGKVEVEWYDPATGHVEKRYGMEVKGTLRFTPPVEGKGKDWVLILKSSGGQTQVATVESGVQRMTFGNPDKLTPYSFCDNKPLSSELAALPVGNLPFSLSDIKIRVNERGVVVEIPLDKDEQLYGLGMQIGTFNQRGLKKRPIVNDNPLNDLGYTHGPSTFYLSNKGYGILINTARYTTFYLGTTSKLNAAVATGGGGSVDELYKSREGAGYVTVDIPGAKGIDVFVFSGPDIRTAMQRYNLFSGGGALPAIWGLGVKYRVKADFNQGQVDAMAAYFRNNHIPCDVLGLEPRWQTASYSCSYVWNNDLFPTPDQFIDSMSKMGFHLNLWEHAFTAPVSPLYTILKDHAGDYKVWNGLVPDFADAEGRGLFAAYHQNTFVEKGISGFKLDECDNSNIAEGHSTWSFPELSSFPSGLSGEQMHQLFGLLYQRTIFDIYKKRNRRTYLDVRASNDFASGYPASLYSDTYDHHQYIGMISTAGFSGMLWSPEVRESSSITDLMRRSQSAVLSAQTLFNSWYLQNPPWLQIAIEKNNHNVLMDSAKVVEAQIRKLLEFRMSLVPYLYNAFAEYHFKGIPPFRALVMDYPDDRNTFNLPDEYMIGNEILAAPLTADEMERKVYLPAGTWYDFNTNQPLEGGKSYTIHPTTTELPIFVKAGAILPLAKPVEHIPVDNQFDITCYVYGGQDAQARLFEDDGYTFDYDKGNYNDVYLTWKGQKGGVSRKGGFKSKKYNIVGWKVIR